MFIRDCALTLDIGELTAKSIGEGILFIDSKGTAYTKSIEVFIDGYATYVTLCSHNYDIDLLYNCSGVILFPKNYELKPATLKYKLVANGSFSAWAALQDYSMNSYGLDLRKNCNFVLMLQLVSPQHGRYLLEQLQLANVNDTSVINVEYAINYVLNRYDWLKPIIHTRGFWQYISCIGKVVTVKKDTTCMYLLLMYLFSMRCKNAAFVCDPVSYCAKLSSDLRAISISGIPNVRMVTYETLITNLDGYFSYFSQANSIELRIVKNRIQILLK